MFPLIFFALLFASPCTSALAQPESDADQTNSPVVKSAGMDKISQSDTDTQPGNEPRELSVFFKIGIAINIVMMLLFAVWFVSEWKKQNRKKTGGTLE